MAFNMSTNIVPTLYSICFDYIKDHTEELVSLEGVPYKPIVQNIIKHLFTTEAPLNKTILAVISNSHSKELRSAQLSWTRIMFRTLSCSVHPRLTTLVRDFPQFLTHLKIGATDLCDDDIYLFSHFTNLVVLDLSENQNISDRTVSYLTTIKLPYLEELHLSDVRGVTDKSLKFFGKMNTLVRIFLTGTDVTADVTKTYLSSIGYELLTKPKMPYFSDRLAKANFKFHRFIEKCSREYPIPINRRMHDYPIPNEKLAVERDKRLDFSRKLTHLPLTTKRKITSQPKHTLPKRPRVNEFLAMVESELFND